MPLLVELLAEPVALLAGALSLLVVMLWRARQRGPLVLAAATLVIYFWVATPLGANAMLGLLEHHPSTLRECGPPADGSVIVVLAGGIDADVESTQDFGRLHGPTLRRVIAAAKLAGTVPGSTLVLAGGGGAAVREADLMSSLVVALGIAAERVRVERESGDTHQNAVQVSLLLRSGGPSPARVHLVTSALHMPRSVAVFRAQGIDVCPHPVDRRWVNPPARHAFIPQMSAFRKSSDVYHEAMGLLAYWLTGKLEAGSRAGGDAGSPGTAARG